MARGGRGQDRPAGAPPAQLLGMAHDVDPRAKAPEVGAVPPVQSFYVNDVQPTVETDGGVTLVCAYHGAGGTGDAVAITMPAGLFAELTSLAPRLLPEAVKRQFTQAQRLGQFLKGAAEAQADEQHRGGPPVDLGDRRGE